MWHNVTFDNVVPQLALRLSNLHFTRNSRKFRKRCDLLLLTTAGFCGLFFCASATWADNLYGRIRGTVTDPSGTAVSGAQITATNSATGVSRAVTSGTDGSYEFLQLIAPDTYTLTAEVMGFKKFEASGLQLNVNQTFVQDIHLELGTLTQTVTVSEAGVTPVETTSMELGQTVNETTIVNMPLNGRDFDQL